MNRGVVLRSLVWVLMVGVAACGSATETSTTIDSDDSTEGSTAAESTAASDGRGATTSADTSGGNPPLDTGYEDDDGGTGCTFTCPDPPPLPPSSTTGGGGLECSLVDQDCPEGEKCMPWANDGGGSWNATRCSPLSDVPDQASEPCTVEGSGVSGIDTCDLGLVCWYVNPKTNEGICGELCGTTEVVGPCMGESEACVEFNDVPMCVEGCDPLDPQCTDQAQGCYVSNNGFFCRTPVGEAAAEGESCDDRAGCEPGLMCLYGPDATCIGPTGEGCCVAPCDVTDPGACEAEQSCSPWFPGVPPAAWADVGYCA